MHETKLPVTADTLVMKLSQWQQTAELVMISDIQSVNGAACETINNNKWSLFGIHPPSQFSMQY